MKLLIIHNAYPNNNVGGEDKVYKNESQALRDELGESNVFFYEVSNYHLSQFKLIFNIWFNMAHYKNIKKLIQDNNIDIAHIHNFYPLLTPSVFKGAKDGGAKVVHTLHNYRLWCISGIFYRAGYGVCELCAKNKFAFFGVMNKCFRDSFVYSFVAWLSFLFYKVCGVFSWVDCFFVLSEFSYQKLIALGIPKSRLILKPNWVNIQNTNKSNSNKKEGYIFIGRLEEQKGIYKLLDIWCKLQSKYVLTIVGGGGNIDELQKKYNHKNIVFKNICSYEQTMQLLSKSKYLIQPSLMYETFGLSIIEAFGFGVPVIGFDIGTRSEFICDKINGFKANENNLKEIIELSYEYKDYEKLSQNAQSSYKKYEKTKTIKDQIKIYKTLLKA